MAKVEVSYYGDYEETPDTANSEQMKDVQG